MTLTIGQLAKTAGIKMTTIRYYERRGLLLPNERSEAGYRLYSSDAITRIHFIKNAQHLGFTLEEIEELLSLQADALTDCRTIKNRASIKISAVERKIKLLQKMKKALQHLHDRCQGKGPISGCPIIDAFSEVKPTGKKYEN